jgi:hypothetical protein
MRMMRAAILLAVVSCAPGAYMVTNAPAQQTQDPQQAAPAVDNRSPSEVVASIIQSQGYACVSTDQGNWQCTPPSGVWSFYVSEQTNNDGSTTIFLDSWAERAFARPCVKFTDAMNDLADGQSAFTATCDDGSKKFRLNTALSYGSDLDVVAWVQNHEQHRMNAAQQLKGIRALSAESLREIAIQ